MTKSQQLRLAAPVAFVYWLLVIGGLVVFTAGRLDHAERLTPLWLGAVAGTAIGQVFALRNMRLWLALGVMVGLAYFSMPLVTASSESPALLDAPALWQVLAPAILCGYWSLGDRALATAFWFPAVLWMLSILDRTGRTGGTVAQLAPDATGGVLLLALALAFFLFLRVRESRRVALWSRIAAEPIAPARPITTLRHRPALHALRAGWGLAITATTALITAWLAPRLWQLEALHAEQQHVAHRTMEIGLACCPSARVAQVQRARVKEYLDIGLGHDDATLPADAGGPACEVCPAGAEAELGDRGIAKLRAYAELADGTTDGDAIDAAELPGGVVSGAGGASVVAAAPGLPAPDARHVDNLPGPAAPTPAAPAPTPVAPAPTPVVPAPPPAPVATPPHAPAISAQSTAPAAAPSTGIAAGPAIHRAAATAPAIWPWLAVFAIAALVMQLVTLGLRPLRRLLVLRHLRAPFWPETIDQRISNAWQLALIGLGDAGWRPDSDEAPRELAARTGVTGIERCAVILERARHGLGLDAGDLTDMLASADAAYAQARAQLGPVPRALSWLRAPLT